MNDRSLIQVIKPEYAQRGEVIRDRLDNSRTGSARFSK